MSNWREAENPKMLNNDHAGTADGDEIAAYLEELHRRLTSGMLRTSREQAAQIADEAGNHLRETAAMGVAAGLREKAAQVAAIEVFGPARTVARAHRPRTAAVLAALAAAACPLLAAYLLLAAAAGGAFAFGENKAVGITGGTPVGQPQVPRVPATGFPAGQAALLLAGCAFAGLAILAGYLITRRRQLSAGRIARAVPLPGFFFPVAGVTFALLAVAERQAAARAPLYSLPGGHELVAVGGPAASVLTALGCAAWSLMLLAHATARRLTHRSSAAVRA